VLSLDRLRALIPPPPSPACIPSSSDWRAVESELGTTLPGELLRFCTVYGLGTFRGTETTALSLGCPGYRGFVEDVRAECQRLRDIRGGRKSRDYPFDVFPDEGGLLPLGLDENDVWLCWATHGPPDRWPVVVRWTWGLDGMRAFEMPLSELLVGLFERSIELPCWPLPTFADDVRFVPFGAPS
jgi:hypothetical protein